MSHNPNNIVPRWNIYQIIEDANKEKAVNARAIEEWEKKHSKLKLAEIE
jgi:hypothetical protein